MKMGYSDNKDHHTSAFSCREGLWTPTSFSIFALTQSRHDYKESLKAWYLISRAQSPDTDCQSVYKLCTSQLLTSISF